MAKKEDKLEFAEIYKDWRDAGYEIEMIGQQLDKAREALARCKKGTWAYNYWNTASTRLFNKWRNKVTMKAVGLVQVGRRDPDWTVRTDWWEGAEEVAGTSMIWIHLADKLTGGPNLERSWQKAQEEKLQKARQGLA